MLPMTLVQFSARLTHSQNARFHRGQQERKEQQEDGGVDAKSITPGRKTPALRPPYQRASSERSSHGGYRALCIRSLDAQTHTLANCLQDDDSAAAVVSRLLTWRAGSLENVHCCGLWL